MHQVPGGLRLLDLVIAGACFSLFYLHTGDLALGIGVQTGALLSGGPLLAWFTVEKSFPGLLGTIHGYGFPTVIMAYGLILGWLWCRTESAGQDWFEGRPGATRSS
ncbi:MAG: hypothetical protein U5K37_08915 [Natrialbaceae archaeon]|nr:hypothetical protein [Natrialbaceae archaeon]